MNDASTQQCNARFGTFSGSPAAIGNALAAFYPEHSKIASGLPKPPMPLTAQEVSEGIAMLTKYCPTIIEELNAYAQALKIDPMTLYYHQLTYLKPHCSQFYLPAKFMADGHPMMARNYEFAPFAEDFAVIKLKPTGRYAHIGGTIALFGRSEGINECGLTVSMTSSGMPVGNMPGMKSPALKGLQFWAVIRELLETCANVGEALKKIETMPLAYNINLLLADSAGHVALYETQDGAHAAIQTLEKALHATNHPIVEPFCAQTPTAMRNSIQRYETIAAFLNKAESDQALMLGDVKKLLLTAYPNGLNCSFYDAYFGTIKSVIMDIQTRQYQICWGGNAENGWQTYSFDKEEQATHHAIVLASKAPTPDFFEQIAF
jgi:predicted choloylglycine hydrolase